MNDGPAGSRDGPLDRRTFLGLSAAFAGVSAAGVSVQAALDPEPLRLVAKPATAALMGPDKPVARVWGYNGQVPGPVLRAAQGDTLKVRFENALPQASTITFG